jgi:hypothetical protein
MHPAGRSIRPRSPRCPGAQFALAVACAWLVVAAPASPQTSPTFSGDPLRELRYVQHFPTAPDTGLQPYRVPVTIPKFDPALGTLRAVDVEFRGRCTAKIAWENTHGAPATATFGLFTYFAFVNAAGFPRYEFGTENSAARVDVQSFAAYDGARDGAGPSGTTVAYRLATTRATHVDDPAALAQYIGTAGYGLDLAPLQLIRNDTDVPGVFLWLKWRAPPVVSARLEVVYRYQ